MGLRTENPSEYVRRHNWIRSQLGKPMICWECGENDKNKLYDWHNISGEYLKNTLDWKRLCRSCHISGHASSTHCPQGHEFTEENTRIRKFGYKQCKECTRIARKNTYWRKRGRPEMMVQLKRKNKSWEIDTKPYEFGRKVTPLIYCSFPGCDLLQHGKNLCGKHYYYIKYWEHRRVYTP